MTSGSIGMGEQDLAEREKFESELKHILKASEEAGILLRVIGSLAFRMHCPQFGYLQAAMLFPAGQKPGTECRPGDHEPCIVLHAFCDAGFGRVLSV